MWNKVWKPSLKYFTIMASIIGFFWLTQPVRAEIEDFEPVTIVEKTTQSSAVQVCNTSACKTHGSGFHLYNGYFITAGHVTGSNKNMWIKNSTGQQQSAKVIWKSTQSDFSLMHVEAWDFLSPPENKITCEEQTVGEQITITGYPADLGNVTTKGSILGIKEGKIGNWNDPYIADINIFFGNSGGPAINSNNEIFGIAVGGLRGTSFSLLEPISKICDILPVKKVNDNDDK